VERLARTIGRCAFSRSWSARHSPSLPSPRHRSPCRRQLRATRRPPNTPARSRASARGRCSSITRIDWGHESTRSRSHWTSEPRPHAVSPASPPSPSRVSFCASAAAGSHRNADSRRATPESGSASTTPSTQRTRRPSRPPWRNASTNSCMHPTRYGAPPCTSSRSSTSPTAPVPTPRPERSTDEPQLALAGSHHDAGRRRLRGNRARHPSSGSDHPDQRPRNLGRHRRHRQDGHRPRQADRLLEGADRHQGSHGRLRPRERDRPRWKRSAGTATPGRAS
jgi:hypothetical protein